LTLQTGRGTYYIQLLWEPQLIQPGKDTKFGIIFMDSSHSIIQGVNYSFKATNPNGSTIKDIKDQKALDGTSIQTVRFVKPDPVDVLITIDAVAGQTTGDFVENADFHLVVAPTSSSPPPHTPPNLLQSST
jgi:hypothetical protein